jgi:hypothetical protein
MVVLSKAWLAAALYLFAVQSIPLDSLQVQYADALAAARINGLPGLIAELDALANASPGSPFLPKIHETILAIGLIHPGSVPDPSTRLQNLRALGTQSAVDCAKRISILEQYYAAAAQGSPDASILADPVLQGSPLALQAAADAAFRVSDWGRAETLAARVIEGNPDSPLVASSYIILGLCSSYRGQAAEAAAHFQRAFTLTPLPTRYGNPQDLLFTAYRFARPAPGAVGDVYDDESITPIPQAQSVKDPRCLLYQDGVFSLIDRDQVLAFSAAGKAMETRAGRRVEDAAKAGPGRTYFITEDAADFGGGTWARLTWISAGKTKNLGKLRSIAVEPQGSFLVLDQEAGLLRGTPAPGNAIQMTQVAQIRGRLLRLGQRGYLYVLSNDQRFVQVYARDLKPLLPIQSSGSGGKEGAIEYFALDALDHLYLLDSSSIQIFGIHESSSGLQKTPLGTVALDQRPAHKNLKVIAAGGDGTVAVAGKNDDNWVVFR